ncbi:MAG: TetR family transcriptional regulator [Rhodospirillales bacterium]|nr:TetR family transcriptional regulator [Rhodospirillales bacterium]
MAKAKAKKSARKATKAAADRGQADLGARAIDAAMDLAAREGWGSVTLNTVAEACGVRLMELYARFPSRTAILAGFARRIDGQVLKGGSAGADAGESPRDRLFDVMMRRYDAMKPYRAAIASIVAEAPRDPLALLCLCGQGRRSMEWMLEAAGIGTGGPLGVLKAKALGAIHLGVLRVWLNDESDDLAKTMAALDTTLARVEPIARTLFARA